MMSVENRICDCGGTLKLTIENGSDPWPETGQKFTGYAEHWTCDDCGWSQIIQVPQ